MTLLNDAFVYGSDVYTSFFEDVKGTESVLNMKHLEALYLYTEGDYKAVRSFLTGRGDRTPVVDIEVLDEAVQFGVRRDRVVWRGTRIQKPVSEVFPVGAVVDEVSFTSCSMSVNVAVGFAAKWNDEGVLVRISTDKGLPLGDYTSVKGASEREVLMPRGMKFTVQKVTNNVAVAGFSQLFTVVDLVEVN